MESRSLFCLLLCWVLLLPANVSFAQKRKPKTEVSIKGEQFYINGKPTFTGRSWQGFKIEGLLPNSRMVQGIYDDENPETRQRWVYPDTKKWDADRNTEEFVDAMPEWKKHGLLAFTLNLQGGSPEGYSKAQPWINSAFDSKGILKPAFKKRLTKIMDKADELGMVVILGMFYFGQEQYLANEKAVWRATDETLDYLFERDYRNVLIEINNEARLVAYRFPLLQPTGVVQLIEHVKKQVRKGRRYLVSTSFVGNAVPTAEVIAASDFILLHGNGVHKPEALTALINKTRAVNTYTSKPIVVNEDDHFAFDQPANNFVAATKAYASWGYFDYRLKGETSFNDGYQSVPVDWGIRSERKKAFFKTLMEITGGL
jgi:hypothetical protein